MSPLTQSQDFRNTISATAPTPPTVLFDALSRMIAHEVRNLLTPARAAAQMAIEDPSDLEQLRATLQRSILACDRVTAITDAILERGSEMPQPIELDAAFREAIEICLPEPTQWDRVQIEGAAGAAATTSAPHLRHILVNLLTNALRATRLPGRVSVTFERSTWNTRPGAVVSISDAGAGFPEEAIRSLNTSRERLQFLPPAAASADRLGVGLMVVRRLAADIGAEIHASNKPAGGAVIQLFIPDLPPALAEAA